MYIRRFLLPAIAMVASTPAITNAAVPLSAEAEKALAGRTIGEPVSCVQLNRIKGTRIIDQTAIIYRQSSRVWYLNQPSQGGCRSLQANRALVMKSDGRICEHDRVTVAHMTSLLPIDECELSRFVPFTK